MRGSTSSPAITHVTAGDAFSAPRLPPHAPLPAGCQTAFQQNHTSCPAKAYLSQGKTIRLTTQNHTFRKHAIRTRHCEASATGTQRRLAEARKREQRKTQKQTTTSSSTTYRDRKKTLSLEHTHDLPLCPSTLYDAERNQLLEEILVFALLPTHHHKAQTSL